MRTALGPMRAVSEGFEPSFLVSLHPAIDALAGHPEGGRHLPHRQAVSDHGQDGVVTLFHLAELHEHSATSSARERAQDGGARLSSINRYGVTDHP
jgi:hypothetical protein